MIIDLTQLEAVTNPKFWPLFENEKRYLVMWGGGGSGKSWFAAEKILLRILVAESEGYRHKFLCLRKTQPAARKSIFALFERYRTAWGLENVCKINKTDMTFTFIKGSQILIGGMDDPEKIKSIEGVTSVWLEEATEFNHEEFTQVDLRLRGETDSYKQIMLSFNPIDEQSWIKKRFFDYKEKDSILHHSTYLDNKFIDPKYAEVLENLIEHDKNYYNVYCLGKWGVLKGLIYENWETIKEWPRRKEFDAHGYGLDFGFTNSPTAVAECGFIDGDCYIRELVYNRGLTNPAICKLLEPFEIQENQLLVADSAEPKSIEEIRQGGYNVFPSIKGKDSVVHGIQRVKQYNLKVYYESVNLIKELNTYKWAEDKDGNILNVPVKFMNHLMDAIRYIVTHLKGLVKGKADFLGTGDETEERKEKLRDAYHLADETDAELLEILERMADV